MQYNISIYNVNADSYTVRQLFTGPPHTMVRILFSPLLILLMLATPNTAMAEGRTVTLGYFARGWAPYEVLTNTIPSGIAVDIFEEIIPDSITKNVELYSKPRELLIHNDAPIYTRLEAIEWVPEPDRFLWSEPILREDSIIVSSARVPLEYSGLDSLEGKIIGCIRNYTYPAIEPLFLEGKATRYDVNKDILLLRMVKQGRVDGVAINKRTALWLLKTTPSLSREDFHFAEQPLSSVWLRFVFNHVSGWKDCLQVVNRRIQAIRENGTLDEILSKYQ